jgi:hypothetical protein
MSNPDITTSTAGMVSSPIRKFRPSNATQGDAFFSNWCRHCQCDKAMREGVAIDDCDDNERCDIIPLTLWYHADDPEYPGEWRYDANGNPICSAFVEAGDPIPRPRCTATMELF